MNKQIISLLLGACLCTSLAGCGNADNNGGSVTKQKLLASKELGSDIAVGAKPAPVDSYEELKNGVNNFAFDLYDALPKDSNCFYSPYSISSALSMLDQGAGGRNAKLSEQRLVQADICKYCKFHLDDHRKRLGV